MTETQQSIGEWAIETFGNEKPMDSRHCVRLLEEVIELCRASGASQVEIVHAAVKGYKAGILHADNRYPDLEHVAEELADCAIVLLNTAHRRGVDLQAEIDKKMAVNRRRRWKLNNDGTGYHQD